MATSDELIDFLLKEYENIARAFFDARETTAKWIKYYLLIMAVPFSFIAFIYKDVPSQFDIFCLPDTLSILISLIGVIGLFLAFIIIESESDSILYARAVNGIRKIFLDRGKSVIGNMRKYVILPDDIKKPSYLGFKKFLWITIVTALINSLYIALGFSQFSLLKQQYVNYFTPKTLMICIFSIFVVIHILFYIFYSNNKQKKYG
jgi:hypothetical protein